MAWTKSNTTKHTCGGPAFGRLTSGCPRCDELANGAAPVVQSWRNDAKREQDRRLLAIRTHDCKRDGCGPVCTRFDW